MTKLSLLALLALLCTFPALASSRQAPVSSDYVRLLEGRIQGLEDQVRALTNQAEQAQFQARSAQERLARLEEDINTRFNMMNGMAAPLTAPPPATSNGGAPITDVGGVAAPRLTPEGTAIANPDIDRLGQLTSNGAPLAEDDPSRAYDAAFQNIRRGDYDAAESALAAFLKRWPKHELSSNAAYWLGETYYVRGDFPGAAKAFAEGYQAYPKGAKSEDTLLKLALTLSALNRTGDACVTLAQMQSEFPRMSQSNRARVTQEQTKLDCEGVASPPAERPARSGRN